MEMELSFSQYFDKFMMLVLRGCESLKDNSIMMIVIAYK